MLTFFTIPKPFEGKIAIIQKNAILSWKKLTPKPEIILFGNELGVEDFAKKFSLFCFPKIKKNSRGTPVLSFVFEKAQRIAKNNFLVYLNCDLILLSDFMLGFKILSSLSTSLFFLTSQRIDLEINDEIQFEKGWEEKLKKKIKKEGKLHGFSGIDWFLFPKKLEIKMLPFAVGRPGWDNWLLFNLKQRKIPIIDATPFLTIIHQNHPSKYQAKDLEARENIMLAGGLTQMLTLREADWVLTSKGFKNPSFWRKILSKLAFFYPWRLILALKRKIIW